MDELKGKKAFIIGGSRGIGKAIAIKYAQEGAEIVICSQNEEQIKKAYEEIKDMGFKVHYFCWDITHVQEADEVMNKADKLMGGLDIVVNVAGVIDREGFLRVREEAFDLIIDVNVKGVYFATQAAANHFINAKQIGRIINIASETGFQPSAMPYGTSKWAVVGFTMGMAKHLYKLGVLVSAIAPGPIATDMMRWEEGKSKEFPNCFGTLGEPEEVADLAVFLGSEKNKRIIGRPVFVSGGLDW